MKKIQWIETKKECDINDRGEYVVKNITLEAKNKTLLGFTKKDFIDLTVRILGLLAIFIPILLFFKQQNAEKSRQKSLLQVDIYSKTITELHALTNKPYGSLEFEESSKKIIYDLYPKLLLLNDANVISLMKPFNINIEFSLALSNVFKNSDIFETVSDSIIAISDPTDTAFKKFPVNSSFFRRNFVLKSGISSSIKQIRYLSEQDMSKNIAGFKEICAKAVTLLFALENTIDEFNNKVYMGQSINIPDILSNRNKLFIFRNEVSDYEIEFFNSKIPTIDSAIIYSNKFLRD